MRNFVFLLLVLSIYFNSYSNSIDSEIFHFNRLIVNKKQPFWLNSLESARDSIKISKNRFEFEFGSIALLRESRSFHYRNNIPETWADVRQHNYNISMQNSYYNPKVYGGYKRLLRQRYNVSLNLVTGIEYFQYEYTQIKSGSYEGGIGFNQFEGTIYETIGAKYLQIELGLEYSRFLLHNLKYGIVFNLSRTSMLIRNLVSIENNTITNTSTIYTNTLYPDFPFFNNYDSFFLNSKFILSTDKAIRKIKGTYGVFIEYSLELQT